MCKDRAIVSSSMMGQTRNYYHMYKFKEYCFLCKIWVMEKNLDTKKENIYVELVEKKCKYWIVLR